MASGLVDVEIVCHYELVRRGMVGVVVILPLRLAPPAALDRVDLVNQDVGTFCVLLGRLIGRSVAGNNDRAAGRRDTVPECVAPASVAHTERLQVTVMSKANRGR